MKGAGDMIKRLLSAGLCICMILSMVPTTALATDGESEGVVPMSENIVYATDAPYNAKGDGKTNDRKEQPMKPFARMLFDYPPRSCCGRD